MHTCYHYGSSRPNGYLSVLSTSPQAEQDECAALRVGRRLVFTTNRYKQGVNLPTCQKNRQTDLQRFSSPNCQLINRQTDLQSLNSPNYKQTNRQIDWQSKNSPTCQRCKVSRELEENEGLQWGKPGPGGAYWRSSAITGQGFFDKMGWWVKWILLQML